jgi:hypothetical protein
MGFQPGAVNLGTSAQHVELLRHHLHLGAPLARRVLHFRETGLQLAYGVGLPMTDALQDEHHTVTAENMCW